MAAKLGKFVSSVWISEKLKCWLPVEKFPLTLEMMTKYLVQFNHKFFWFTFITSFMAFSFLILELRRYLATNHRNFTTNLCLSFTMLPTAPHWRNHLHIVSSIEFWCKFHRILVHAMLSHIWVFPKFQLNWKKLGNLPNISANRSQTKRRWCCNVIWRRVFTNTKKDVTDTSNLRLNVYY